jgi:hypothetical protein
MRNVCINGVHELEDVGLVLSIALKSRLSGTLDDWDVVTWEVILAQEVANFHLHEFEEIWVSEVHFVHEHHESGNADLTGEQDVLTSLGHGAVCGGHNQDAAIHLCGAGDHVLHVVSVTGAIHVCVVALLGLVLNVSGVDGDAALLLFGSGVNLVVGTSLSKTFLGEHRGDSRSEGGLAMVNVADRANVDVGLVTLECFFSHLSSVGGSELGRFGSSGARPRSLFFHHRPGARDRT